jgi:osmotically-inducible protein OsmY
MAKTSHTKTNSATSIDVVIADPNSTVVLSKQQNLYECGSTNQRLSERRNRAGNQTGLVNVMRSLVQSEVPNGLPSSDCETRNNIKSAIELSGYPDVRRLLFSVERGVVTVRGHFSSFYLCQVAIECVKRVPGVDRVKNHIEVVYALISKRDSVESDGESKPHLRSRVELSVSEGAANLVYSRPTVLPTCEESACFAEAACRD